MTKPFIETAASRETDPELMEAIWRVSGYDEARAVSIWENGPTDAELVAICEIVTKNGMHEPSDFCWGEAGGDWLDAFTTAK